MSDEQILTAPVVESTGTETPAPETPQVAQVTPEPQETTTVAVENGSKEPQVPEVTRRKPSDYYRERQTIRELKEEVAALRKWREGQAPLTKKQEPVIPEAPDYDPAHFSPDHKRILAAREKALRDYYDSNISALREEIGGLREDRVQAESQRKHQEALEELFPKTSPDSKESLNERMAKDPDRVARIQEILLESGLNELSKVNPAKAAKYVLQELGEANKPAAPNPTVLKKTMMGGSQTGNPSMGQKRSAGEADLLAEKNKLNDQLSNDPALRQDEKFMERRRQVLGEIERLVTKK